MPGLWKSLNNPPGVNIDAMLLLTDGAVMSHEYRTSNWHKLTPDKNSDYANGTWSPMAPMPNNAPISQNGPANAPLYFASAVLRDGSVFCAGGEYNDGSSEIYFLAAETYDPVADVWTAIATPAGWTNIGDASSCVLPDGRILLGNDDNTPNNVTAIWDPESQSWSAGGDSLDSNSEEGWTLLPDGTVLAVQCSSIPNAQKYVIATNQWVDAGATVSPLPAGPPGDVPEMGPQILLPDGRVFAIGASGHTGLYAPPNTVPTDPGTWAAGPDFPASGGQLMAAVDAPACLLPNGNVLCVVGPIDAQGFSDPTQFFEFNPSTGALIAAPAPAIAATSPTYNARLLLLPTGQVLYSVTSDSGTYDLQMYTPAGGPQAGWRPHITHVPRHLQPGQVYRLHGRQLNGLSQACAYGDDQQMATNYPLVRLRGHPSVGDVFCRTFDHSTMAVATGAAIHHTHFHVPHDLPHGEYRLEVIANGIASASVEMHVHRHHDHDDHMRHDHDEEVFKLEHDDAKYKDKDAKEAKEKEKDIKEAKEKDAKEVKEKDVKEFKEKDGKEAEHKGCKEKEHKEYEQKVCKEKEHKEFEQKACKDKEHKEYEQKSCKEKEHAEQTGQPWREERGEYGELLQKIEQIGERLERIERDVERRPFIKPEERPDVGAQSMRRRDEEIRRSDDRRHDDEMRRGDDRRHDDEMRRGDDRRHDEEMRRGDDRRHDEEPRRGDENHHGEERRSEPPRPEPPARSAQPRVEPPAPTAPRKRPPPKGPRG
jgi:hypothetical protein